MSKLARMVASFIYQEDPDPTHGPAVDFVLFYGLSPVDFATMDPTAPPAGVNAVSLGLLPDLGDGKREFNVADVVPSLPNGTYDAAVVAKDAAGNWSDSAVAPNVPFDVVVPPAPHDLKIEPR